MSEAIPLHSHQLDKVTEYDRKTGWSMRTFEYEEKKYTDLYERPSDKGWITPLVISSWHRHLSKTKIQKTLFAMEDHETRGDHDDVE